MKKHPGFICKTLSETMWILSVPTASGSVKPWTQNRCAFLFSSKDAVVRFGTRVPVSREKGLFEITSWESLLLVLQGLESHGCTHVAIDPEGASVVPQRIHDVLVTVQQVIDGELGFGANPN